MVNPSPLTFEPFRVCCLLLLMPRPIFTVRLCLARQHLQLAAKSQTPLCTAYGSHFQDKCEMLSRVTRACLPFLDIFEDGLCLLPFSTASVLCCKPVQINLAFQISPDAVPPPLRLDRTGRRSARTGSHGPPTAPVSEFLAAR